MRDVISEYEERLLEGDDVILRARLEVIRARTLQKKAQALRTTLS